MKSESRTPTRSRLFVKPFLISLSLLLILATNPPMANAQDQVVVFAGAVTKLTYEVHPSAEKVLREITTEVTAQFDVTNVSVAHRYGEIPIGQTAFAVAVSAAHRGAAFDCCRELVERVKSELPIWKFQEFEDGTSEWVNSA